MQIDHVAERTSDQAVERLGSPPLLSLTDYALTALFLLVFYVQLAHHNMWRDELNVYGIAAASPTLGSLLHHVRYEGHPWLWYVLVWVTQKFVPTAISLKVVEAVVGTFIYLVLWLRSPFSRTEKVLLSLSYFISFEYTVMSRMYSVLLLLALVYAGERTVHPGRAVRNALLLGLMASTDVMGMILSGALLVEYAYASFVSRPDPRLPTRQRFGLGILAYGLTTLLAIASARPMPDVDWRTTGHIFSYAGDRAHFFFALVDYVVLPFFPVAFGLHTGPFWNPQPDQHPVFFAICIPVVLLAYGYIFRRHKSLLLLVGAALVMSVGFGHFIYLGWIRHSGVMFIAFVVGLWLLRTTSPRLPALALAMVGLTALAGLYADMKQWRRPFSNSEPAAAWLRAQHLDRAPLVGVPDATVAEIAELLRRPVYMLDCSCTDTFLLFSNRRSAFKDEQVPDRLAVARRDLGTGDFILLSGWPLSAHEQTAMRQRGLSERPLAQFTKAETFGEDYYIYQVHDADSAGPSTSLH